MRKYDALVQAAIHGAQVIVFSNAYKIGHRALLDAVLSAQKELKIWPHRWSRGRESYL